MLSRVNRGVHLEIKVELVVEEVNALLETLVAQRGAILQQVVSQVFAQLQEHWIEQVEHAEAELVCRSCGVVHVGRGSWVRRGWRARLLQTLAGPLVLPLAQTTCRLCGKTRALDPDRLGLCPRARYTQSLKRAAIERVYETSYRRSARLARDVWSAPLSASTLHGFVQAQAAAVKLTPSPRGRVLLADGTKVPAGARAQQEELRLCFQLLGRTTEAHRPRAQLRLVGLAAGLGSWPEVLRTDCPALVVVTDAEASLPAHVRACYPEARHQWCEWHVGYTLNWSLLEDGLGVKARRGVQQALGSLLWGGQQQATKQAGYEAFLQRMPPRTRKQLERARPFILFDSPSAERTTSLVERQMREVNRRVDVGVRWSVPGVRNLMLLSLTQKHNPDDYQRLWN